MKLFGFKPDTDENIEAILRNCSYAQYEYYVKTYEKMLPKIIGNEQLQRVLFENNNLRYVKLPLRCCDNFKLQNNIYIKGRFQRQFADRYDICFLMERKYSRDVFKIFDGLIDKNYMMEFVE